MCIIWKAQTIHLLKAELVQSCTEKQDAKGTLTPAKPDLSLLATGNSGTDVWCWDFSPKISLMFNSHFTDLPLPCMAWRRTCYRFAGQWRRFIPFLKMTQEKFVFASNGPFFKHIHYYTLGSLYYLPHLKQRYYSLNSWALSFYRERPNDVTG